MIKEENTKYNQFLNSWMLLGVDVCFSIMPIEWLSRIEYQDVARSLNSFIQFVGIFDENCMEWDDLPNFV